MARLSFVAIAQVGAGDASLRASDSPVWGPGRSVGRIDLELTFPWDTAARRGEIVLFWLGLLGAVSLAEVLGLLGEDMCLVGISTSRRWSLKAKRARVVCWNRWICGW